jgi:Uma2 family endonuclease
LLARFFLRLDVGTMEPNPGTMMDVYKTLPEGTLAELVDGIIHLSPSPLHAHQRLLLRLASGLNRHVIGNGLGEIFIAPLDVYLDEHSNAVQPDIIFIAAAHASMVHDHVHGVPDLVIEILSPGNRDYDLKKKRDLYEKFGVQEYWIVDPVTTETLGYQLREGKYQALATPTGALRSRLLRQDFYL